MDNYITLKIYYSDLCKEMNFTPSSIDHNTTNINKTLTLNNINKSTLDFFNVDLLHCTKIEAIANNTMIFSADFNNDKCYFDYKFRITHRNIIESLNISVVLKI